MELSDVPNPFDFANPVYDESLFVGRKDELREITYYLEHAARSSRPINIAILGPRASGKTSLLNMCEIEAIERGLCPVRIDLDEGDAESQLAFFYKIFNGILTTVCEAGAYGGVMGKTYEMYLDIVNAYTIPEDKTFCPFLFPLQYAKAMASGNTSVNLQDHNFRRDLSLLRSELDCPVVLLFDEGNVLAGSRVHLEKLRNIFMNTPGFMLIITGTPELFPLIDDVFSPIIRQFKKVIVGGFRNRQETRECIEKPLRSVGISPNEVMEFGFDGELHDLTSGRPYELQLVCHILFRRLQEKRARSMDLNLSVLEEVRRELETSQRMSSRPILSTIGRLSLEQLRALNLLCKCDGQATFEQIWGVEYIVRGEEPWTRQTLKSHLDNLVTLGVIEHKDQIIRFAGDDFDKIYTKYFAREKGVPVSFEDYPLGFLCFLELRSLLGSEKTSSLLFGGLSDAVSDVRKVASALANSDPDQDVFVETPVVQDLYFLMLRYRKQKTVSILSLKVEADGLNDTYFLCSDPGVVGAIDNLAGILSPWATRAIDIGAKLDIERIELEVIPVEVLVRKVEQTSNEQLRTELAERHVQEVADQYVGKRNVDEALFHANLVIRYGMTLDCVDFNNMGYLFMSTGNLDEARKCLEKAVTVQPETAAVEGVVDATDESDDIDDIDETEETYQQALGSYNLGVLESRCGNLVEALNHIEFCIRKVESLPRGDRECACLFVLVQGEDGLGVQEVWNPDLLETAQESKNVLLSLVARTL